MRQVLRLVLPGVAAACLIGIGTPPAHAHTDVCAGTYSLVAQQPLGVPVTSTVSTGFVLTQTTGACVSGNVLKASGTLVGACGLGTGYGITSTGHQFDFTLAAEMVFSFQVTGAMTVTEDPNDPNDCLNGTAIRFVLTGSVLLTP
jgi:hypothetical protein